MHLLNVKRFTGPPISALAIDQSRLKHEDIVEVPRRSRLNPLKPMIKNFEVGRHYPAYDEQIQTKDACILNKTFYDYQIDTKDVEQPAMFTEYIRKYCSCTHITFSMGYLADFFQKQAEEKQIRRISLTAIRTDEHMTKRLAARVPRLYNGYQPSDRPCAHTDAFRPLHKYLMSDISYYFDSDFHDHSGLFQRQKSFDKSDFFPSLIESFQSISLVRIAPQVKQPTQRFRDNYIVKEFFNCWRDYAAEKARLAELRRNRVAIDFREFWFQDALSEPFYSYFERPSDYQKKQTAQHQLAYRLHKRLVRTGREQPKETMKKINRSSYLPYLFNLPKNYLDRQGSLTRRRQTLDNDDSILLSNLLSQEDDLLPFIRERLQRNFPSLNLARHELPIKDLVIQSSILSHGTIKDFDQILTDYYMSHADQLMRTSSNSIVKLPMIKRASSISQSKFRSSNPRRLTMTE